MSTISIMIKATLQLPVGPSKAAQLAFNANAVADQAANLLRKLGGEVTVLSQADDARLGGSGIAVKRTRGRPRRKKDDAKPTIIIDPAAIVTGHGATVAAAEAPAGAEDLLEVPGFLRRN